MVSLLLVIALVGSAFAAPPDTNCGEPAIAPSVGNTFENGRIVGGKEAVPNSWPWQVQVRYNGGHYCGASLVSSDYIISAAHCFRGNSPSAYSFRFGRHSKSGTNEAYEQIATAAAVTIHESYNPLTINNDVAVIRVTPSVTYTNQVSPVCLPLTAEEPADDSLVHITGWGSTEGTCCATVLKQVEVPIVNRDKCNQADYYNGAIKPGMICAGLDQGGLDSCQGDSGGPLVQKSATANKWQLYGIVSWGSGCADPKKPGVYTNVAYYDAWIRSKVTQIERDEQTVAGKFRPAPYGAAFREQAREQVLRGELNKWDLPMNGEWLEE